LHVFGPQFLWGGEGPPEFLDLHYKAHLDSDHVAKFHGDRLRELGGSPVKEIKKTSRVKHKAFGTNVPGGLIIILTKTIVFTIGNGEA